MTTQTEFLAPAEPSNIVKDTAGEAIVPRKFTVAEYYRMGEAGIFHPEERVELIEGVVVVLAPIGIRHAGSVIRYIQVFFPAGWRPVHTADSKPHSLGRQYRTAA